MFFIGIKMFSIGYSFTAVCFDHYLARERRNFKWAYDEEQEDISFLIDTCSDWQHIVFMQFIPFPRVVDPRMMQGF